MTAKRHLEQGNQLAWMQGEQEAALEEYRLALTLDPTLAQAHWRIGQVHFFASPPRIEEALAAFHEAVRLNSEGSEAHYWLGIGFAENKQYREAIQEYRDAIRLSEKEDERLFIALGDSLQKAGHHAEAVKAYDEGIRVARFARMGYYLMLADALHASRQKKRACTAWKQAIALAHDFDEEELADVEQARTNLQKHCQG